MQLQLNDDVLGIIQAFLIRLTIPQMFEDIKISKSSNYMRIKCLGYDVQLHYDKKDERFLNISGRIIPRLSIWNHHHSSFYRFGESRLGMHICRYTLCDEIIDLWDSTSLGFTTLSPQLENLKKRIFPLQYVPEMSHIFLYEFTSR